MASEMGELGASGSFNIGKPQIKKGDVQDVVNYVWGDNAFLMEIIDPATGEIKEIMVMATWSDNPENFQNNTLLAHFIYIASIRANNMNLTNEDMNNIQKKLGILNKNTLFTDMSTVYKNIKYSKSIVKSVGISFIISAQ